MNDAVAYLSRAIRQGRGLDKADLVLKGGRVFDLVTGELRVGVSQTLVVRALAQAAQLPAATLAARIMGEWTPSPEWYSALLSHERTDDDRSRPYPFFLASPLADVTRPDDSEYGTVLALNRYVVTAASISVQFFNPLTS